MGLFGWFSKKQPAAPPAATPPRPARPEPEPELEAGAPEPEPTPEVTGDQAFGGAIAVGLARYLQSRAQDMRAPGDKQYVSLLLRAVRNDGVEIPAMPTDLMEIQRLLSSPDTEIADLAKAVQRDPGIAAKFVSVANSPLYRGIREVSSVREAIVRIGLNHAGMILLAIISSSKLFKVPGREEEAKWLHAHSLSTAVTCQYLARLAGENEESAFMAGLLHDLGRVFLLSMAQEVFRTSRGEHAVTSECLEELSTHAHAGFSALTAQYWNYRGNVVSAIQHHEVPPEDGARLVAMAPAEHGTLIQILAAANLLDRYEEEELPQTAKEILHDLGLGDVEEVAMGARETASLFLSDLGVRRVPYPF